MHYVGHLALGVQIDDCTGCAGSHDCLLTSWRRHKITAPPGSIFQSSSTPQTNIASPEKGVDVKIQLKAVLQSIGRVWNQTRCEEPSIENRAGRVLSCVVDESPNLQDATIAVAAKEFCMEQYDANT